MVNGRKKITFYSLSTCPFCKRMKQFLDNNGLNYELIEVDTLEGGRQWAAMKEVKRHNPDATFPTVVLEEAVMDIESLKEALKIG